MEIGKEREVRVGDVFLFMVSRYLRECTVVRVAAKEIWLRWTSMTAGKIHITKHHRTEALKGTKYC
jgi:hypothetical protein